MKGGLGYGVGSGVILAGWIGGFVVTLFHCEMVDAL